MSEALDALQEGFEARVELFSEIQGLGPTYKGGLLVLRTGVRFFGIIMPFPGVDPAMELGEDIRELSTIQILRDDMPDIKSQDKIKQITVPGIDSTQAPIGTSQTSVWKVVRRDDNPADFAVKLWVVKVTPQDVPV